MRASCSRIWPSISAPTRGRPSFVPSVLARLRPAFTLDHGPFKAPRRPSTSGTASVPERARVHALLFGLGIHRMAKVVGCRSTTSRCGQAPRVRRSLLVSEAMFEATGILPLYMDVSPLSANDHARGRAAVSPLSSRRRILPAASSHGRQRKIVWVRRPSNPSAPRSATILAAPSLPHRAHRSGFDMALSCRRMALVA